MKGVRQTHRLLHDLCDLSLNEDISDDSTQHGDSLENPDEWMHLMSQALSSRTPLQTIQRFWLLILYKKGSWRFRAGSHFLKFEQQEGALGPWGLKSTGGHLPLLVQRTHLSGGRPRWSPLGGTPDTSLTPQTPTAHLP